MNEAVTPFKVSVEENQLQELRERIRRTRWPERETCDGWDQGVPLAYAREMADYWADEYDWRRWENRLNQWPQYKTEIDGIDIHFIHLRSSHDNALPVIISHGWPGSVVEFHKIIEPLASPEKYGGSIEDAFHVVIPSLPGYGFSGKSTTTGTTADVIGRMWGKLMARLGYDRYVAQGGDWGAMVTTCIGAQDHEHCAAIHLNMPIVPVDPDTMESLTEAEQSAEVPTERFVPPEESASPSHRVRSRVRYDSADEPFPVVQRRKNVLLGLSLLVVLSAAWLAYRYLTLNG